MAQRKKGLSDNVMVEPALEEIMRGIRPEVVKMVSIGWGGTTARYQRVETIWYPIYEHTITEYNGDIEYDVSKSTVSNELYEKPLLPKDIPQSHIRTIHKIGQMLFPENVDKYYRVRLYGSRSHRITDILTVITVKDAEGVVHDIAFESNTHANIWLVLEKLRGRVYTDIKIRDMDVRVAAREVFNIYRPVTLIGQARENSLTCLYILHSLVEDVRKGERAAEILRGLDKQEYSDWLIDVWEKFS
ncbi:MAG: hypothetical protein RTU30_14735 [Candidatus Thorarchaeota archaeon]